MVSPFVVCRTIFSRDKEKMAQGMLFFKSTLEGVDFD